MNNSIKDNEFIYEIRSINNWTEPDDKYSGKPEYLSDIYKVKIDGTEEIRLTNSGKVICPTIDVLAMSLVDDWLYYIGGFRIRRVRTDGTKDELIGDDFRCTSISIIDDWIYYEREYTMDSGMSRYPYTYHYCVGQMKIDGSERIEPQENMELRQILGSEEKRNLYEERVKAIRDENSRIKTAENNAKREVAKNLLKRGVSISHISEDTGLTISEIKKLKNN